MRRLLPAIALITATAACGAAGTQSVRPAAASKPAPASVAQPVAAHQARSVVIAGKPAGPKVGVGHIFMIVLENESYNSTYVNNPYPYLRPVLEKQGTLLTQYYATGHHSLDNYLSILSGQAPNTTTSADCVDYNAIPGDQPLNSHGQEVGTGGCIYPHNVPTLAGQLTAKKVSWHGWMEDMGKTASREESRCGVPNKTALGTDDTQVATATDQYAARHNPFVYFKSIPAALCKKNVVPLTGLPTALKKISTTPRFNWITPNLCDDGHDAPCHGKDSKGFSDGGLLSIDHFLKTWVPQIEHSPAFKKDGLLIITSDESDSGDNSSCCGEKPGPTDGNPGDPGPGGGRIGTLVIGHCVAANHQDAVKYNHYSLLKSLENLYGITTGGTDHHGHIGYAGVASLHPFGADVFSKCKSTA